MNENKNIEELFREKFSSAAVEPHPEVWGKIEKSLPHAGFISTIRSLSIYIFAFSMFLLLLIIAPISIKKSEKQSRVNIPSKVEKPVSSEQVKEVAENNTPKNSLNKLEVVKTEKKKERKLVVSADFNSQDKKELDKVSGNTKQNIELLKKENVIDLLKPQLIIDKKQGCAPFSAEISVLNVNSEDFVLDMGDGEKVTQSDVLHTFNDEGTYIIRLYIANELVAKDTIVVYETPKIVNNWEGKTSFRIGETLELTTVNDGNVYNKWYFDADVYEGNRVRLKTSKAGVFPVSLVKWNEHNCKDSLFLVNLVVEEQEYTILFPTAFAPNTEGEPDAHYDIHSSLNEIFFPVMKGVEKFTFKIYNRRGVLLFETSDPTIGWNGYYKHELMPEGVYVWKAEGNFINGERFVKAGNLTLIIK